MLTSPGIFNPVRASGLIDKDRAVSVLELASLLKQDALGAGRENYLRAGMLMGKAGMSWLDGKVP